MQVAAKLRKIRRSFETGVKLNPKQRELIETAASRRELTKGLSIEELSAFLGVSVRTIQGCHTHGNGPPRKRRSHKLVYPIPELMEWLQRPADDPSSEGTHAERTMEISV